MTTTYPPTAEGVTAALTALGATEYEVAATLLAGGHRGYVNECAACPVAAYLYAVFPSATFVQVDDRRAYVWFPGDVTHEVAAPSAVAEFVAAFDSGQHHELDVTEAAR
jgi:hypothetical protein